MIGDMCARRWYCARKSDIVFKGLVVWALKSDMCARRWYCAQGCDMGSEK
jgi:hypothetical protein